MVPVGGLEPPRPKATDFESIVPIINQELTRNYTYSTQDGIIMTYTLHINGVCMAILQKHSISPDLHVQLVDNSTKWQIRYKDKSGKWRTKSSGKTDLLEAVAVAQQATAASTNTFRSVAIEYSHTLPDTRKSREQLSALHTWLLPYIGSLPIDQVKQAHITAMRTEQDADFRTKFHRIPARSTLLNWNAAANAVFGYALERDMLHHTQIPQLTAKGGTPATRRDAFTNTELLKIRNSEFWTPIAGQKPKTRKLRQLLKHYFEFLLGTGIRHGTESENIRASDFRAHEKKGNIFGSVLIRKGKTTLHTGDRPVVLKQDVKAHYNAMRVLSGGDYLLSIPKNDNRHITERVTAERLGDVFKQLCKFENITDKTLYSARHTYITNLLLDGVEPAKVARQCGTSIEMLDRHYSHITAIASAEDFL